MLKFSGRQPQVLSTQRAFHLTFGSFLGALWLPTAASCQQPIFLLPTPPLQEAIHLTLDRFPETLRMQLGVGGMGLECPEGTLIRTGGQLHRLVSATDLTGGFLLMEHGMLKGCHLRHTAA